MSGGGRSFLADSVFKDMDLRMSISSQKGSKKQHGFMYCMPHFDACTPATSQDLDFLSL